MRKKYRKQDNAIIISGVILAAAVIVLCIFGYHFLNSYLSDTAKKNRNKAGVLSEEMQSGLVYTQAAVSLSATPTPIPQLTEESGALVTVLPENQHDMVLTPTMDPNQYWAVHGTPAPDAYYGEATGRMTTSFEAETSGYDRIPVAYALASSRLYQDGYDNSPIMAFDGDPVSSWQEGVDGYGEGQVLRALFNGTHKLNYISFQVGNWRDSDAWRMNTRPAKMTVWIGNAGFEVTFSDTMKEFCLAFSTAIPASEVSFEIQEVYPGESQESWDNCISEITFYGN